MFELPSAIFSIADGNEFRFARFYIVCEAVPLEALGNPLIVCGLSDTSVECQSVAKTRNPMPGAMWKKCSHFAPKNRRRQVPAGTRYHLVITSCPCFSPPCPRDASGFLASMIRRSPVPRDPVSGRYRRQPGCRLKARCLYFRCGSLSVARLNS